MTTGTVDQLTQRDPMSITTPAADVAPPEAPRTARARSGPRARSRESCWAGTWSAA